MRNFPLQRKRQDHFFPELDFGRLFEDFFKSSFGFGLGVFEKTPAIDIFEKGANVVVKAELPGVKPEEIKLSVDGNLLSIRGERKHEKEIKKEDYYQAERSYGGFQRTVELPHDVKPEGAKATYKNGILQIELPKTESERRKEIKIDVE